MVSQDRGIPDGALSRKMFNSMWLQQRGLPAQFDAALAVVHVVFVADFHRYAMVAGGNVAACCTHAWQDVLRHAVNG